MQCIINDVPIHYLDEGKGPAVLLLHGWLNDLRSFDQITSRLIRRFRVIRPDLPNFGGSGKSDKFHSLDDYSGLLNSFLAKLELPKVRGIVGHSMGGQIAIHAVASGSVNTEHLVLLASAGVRDENRLRKAAIRTSAKLAKPFVSTRLKERLYKKIGSDYTPSLPVYQRAVLKQVLEHDIQTDAAKVKVPTLLLYGAQDTATPPRYGQRFHELIDGSSLEVIDAGHHLHQDHPDTVAKLIEDFIR